MKNQRTTIFQSFEDISDPTKGEQRAAALRKELRALELDGFLVPHADNHQSEYPPKSEQRLKWLTGFSGSAGFAIILTDRAALFVDGRYTLQAPAQVDETIFEIRHLIDEPPATWLKAEAPAGSKIGYDPWLLTRTQVERFEKAAAEADASLIALQKNPIDKVWTDRPPAPNAAVELHGLEYAGESSLSKVERLQADLKEQEIDAAVITMAESVAWLLNIRGKDVSHVPLTLANAILPQSGKPKLFTTQEKISNEIAATLTNDCDIHSSDSFVTELSKLAGAKVQIDPGTTPYGVVAALNSSEVKLVEGSDPCALPRAIKNETEIAGARSAHARDAVAVSRFLAWLDRTAPQGNVDEIGAVEALEEFRRGTGALLDISFETISGAGPNGAIIHYRVSEETNRPLDQDNFYLVDSGGQYRDGTTDITRTIAIGTPSEEMRRHFTFVLKGMIAISKLRFPEKTTGAQIDALARAALWNAGLNYDHGTGHGVGSYLGVHEGPQRIAKTGTVPLEPGMMLSNEPGYYKADSHGIRIENLILVTPTSEIEGGDRPMLGFETLTYVPIDRRAIIIELLNADELDWLNKYHREVFDRVAPSLDQADLEWLKGATAPLGPSN